MPHTPVPWSVGRTDAVSGEIAIMGTTPRGGEASYAVAVAIPCGDGWHGNDAMPEMTAANARRIVLCVNTHDDVLMVLVAASHALKSYALGNASPELAEEIAAACDAAIAKTKGASPCRPE